jgi:hypothetical protein
VSARLSRRRLLQGALAAGGALLVAPRGARAIGRGSKLTIGRLDLGPGSDPRPTALSKLLFEIDKRTSIDCDLKAHTVELSDDKLHLTPFLYLSGDRSFSTPGSKDLERLRRFLTYGGFLLVDSAEGALGGAFDKSVRELASALFDSNDKAMAALPADHVVYKSFYLLDEPYGRVAVASDLEAIVLDGRAAMIYCQNDLGGAWARDNFGNYDYECYPGGERQRELAYRLGINVTMYALCLDYKTDQVHVPFILKRRRWKVE